MIRRVGYYVFVSQCGGILLTFLHSLSVSDEPDPMSFIPWSLQTGERDETRETADKDHIFEKPVK